MAFRQSFKRSFVLEDQQYVLKQLIEVLEREQPDALIIAGDIYDTAYPSKYVIQLMEETIAKSI